MLRSTSIKNDQWKPVKLLARQTLDSKVLDSSSSSSGDLVGVLTESDVNIFSNRELIGTINVEGGKSIHVTEDATSILVLSSEKLTCYSNWGKIKWESKEVHQAYLGWRANPGPGFTSLEDLAALVAGEPTFRYLDPAGL